MTNILLHALAKMLRSGLGPTRIQSKSKLAEMKIKKGPDYRARSRELRERYVWEIMFNYDVHIIHTK